MPNGLGGLIPRRTSPLRNVTIPSGTDPAAAATMQGVGTAINALGYLEEKRTQGAQQKLENEQRAAQLKVQQQNADLGTIGKVTEILGSKSVPKSVKVQMWNDTLVPLLNKARGGYGGNASSNSTVPVLDQWLDPLEDAAKAAHKVIYDKKLSTQQKWEYLSAIQAEVGNDVRLAPQIEAWKAGMEQQAAQDQPEAIRLFNKRATEGLTPQEEDELYAIKGRSPGAFATARDTFEKQPSPTGAGFHVGPRVAAPGGPLPALPAQPPTLPTQGAPAAPSVPEAQAPAAPAASRNVQQIDNEIQTLMQQINTVRVRVPGAPTRADMEKRLADLREERKFAVEQAKPPAQPKPAEKGAGLYAQYRAEGKTPGEAASRALAESGDVSPEVAIQAPEVQTARLALARAPAEAAEQTKHRIAMSRALPGNLQKFTGFKTRGEAEGSGFVFDPESKEVKDFSKQLSAAGDAFEQMDRVQQIVKETPTALGVSGSFAARYKGALDQVRNVINTIRGENTNVPVSEETLNKFSNSVFEQVGITNRTLQSNLRHLIIRVAEAEGYVGRELTDRKLQLMEEVATGATQSAEAFQAVVDDIRRRTHDSTLRRGEAALGARGKPLLTEKQLAGFGGVAAPPVAPPPPPVPVRSGGVPAAPAGPRVAPQAPQVPAPGEIRILRRRPAGGG